MSIDVTCLCGRRYRVKDKHAGRRARCPGCGAVLEVPAPGPPAAPSTSAPAGSRATPAARLTIRAAPDRPPQSVARAPHAPPPLAPGDREAAPPGRLLARARRWWRRRGRWQKVGLVFGAFALLSALVSPCVKDYDTVAEEILTDPEIFGPNAEHRGREILKLLRAMARGIRHGGGRTTITMGIRGAEMELVRKRHGRAQRVEDGVHWYGDVGFEVGGRGRIIAVHVRR